MMRVNLQHFKTPFYYLHKRLEISENPSFLQLDKPQTITFNIVVANNSFDTRFSSFVVPFEHH